MGEVIVLRRDCDAILVPAGEAVRLPAGMQVELLQSPGGHFTVQTEWGYLARIAAEDCDALALPPPGAAEPPAEGPLQERLLSALRAVFDPEIPVNVVDLGLVYACEATPLPDGRQRVQVRMSMTAPGCGMGGELAEDARQRLLAVPGVAEVDVELVWDPPWEPSRMSEAARLQLGWL